MANLPNSSDPNHEKVVGSNTNTIRVNPSLHSSTSVSPSNTPDGGLQCVPPLPSKLTSLGGSSPTSPNKGGDDNMMGFAKSSLATQHLYSSLIPDRLVRKSQKRTFTQIRHIHNTINYSSVCGLSAPPHLSSSKKQPKLIINEPDPDPDPDPDPAPALAPVGNNNVKGKKIDTPSSTTKCPSIEDFLETIHLKRMVNKPIITKNEGIENAPNHQQKQSTQVVINMDDGNSDDDGGNNNENDYYDGQIHSLPCSKNGPYKCSKCEKVYLTSQQFAAHVSSIHYKSETKEQRRMRQLAKMRKRNLRIQHVKNEDLTIAPIFYEWEGAATSAIPVLGGNNSTDSKSATNGGSRSGDGSISDGQGGGAFSSSKVKEELGGNDFVVPPGFQGVTIKREPFA